METETMERTTSLHLARALRAEAERFQHAVIREVTIDHTRRVEHVRIHHYLTCWKCKLLRRAILLEREAA